ncbi:MAG: hypothetical protein AAGA32_04315 [Pseudomonadota bacterium]
MSDTDADLKSPLERAFFAPGMMLDVATIRAEQDYHRRRLNRHRYWYAGTGTIVGLAVSLRVEPAPNPTDNAPVQIVVGPGVGIDGLGREILLSTPHCLDLLAWIGADGRDAEALADGLDTDANVLRLTVSARHEDCPTGLRPVLARKVNASTSPVDTQIVRDDTALSLAPGAAPERSEAFWPWPTPQAPSTDPLDEATTVETDAVAALAGAARTRAELAARLIYGLEDHGQVLETEHETEELAAIPLAEIAIDLRPDQSPFVHPDHVTVNNLVRPMVATPSQLDWLARQTA